MISRYDSDHNHDRELPPGLSARRPPTKEQRDAIAKIDEGKNLTRRQVADLLRIHDPDHSLEVRQVSNVMNLARKETRDQVKAHWRRCRHHYHAYRGKEGERGALEVSDEVEWRWSLGRALVAKPHAIRPVA